MKHYAKCLLAGLLTPLFVLLVLVLIVCAALYNWVMEGD